MKKKRKRSGAAAASAAESNGARSGRRSTRGLPAKESIVAVKAFITPKGNRRVILKTSEVDEYEEDQ